MNTKKLMATARSDLRDSKSQERHGKKGKSVSCGRVAVFAVAALFGFAAFGKISYCEKGTKREHSHFSSHDIPAAGGVNVKIKGPNGYSCATNEHPFVAWSRTRDGGRVVLSVDIISVDKKKSDLYAKWIRAERVQGEHAQMPVGDGWKEQANAVMTLGNVNAVAADMVNEAEHAWRHLSLVPAEGGKVVIVDFRAEADSVKAAKKLAGKASPEVKPSLKSFKIANPLVKDKDESTATGWFVTPTHLVTCAHCTKNTEACWIFDENDGRVDLKLVGSDEKADVAVLEVATPGWRSPAFLSIAKSTPRRAEKVWTLGYPLSNFIGETIKYGEGVVTSHEGAYGDTRMFSVTAPIRLGSSGGPVFDAGGKVCGIMSSTLNIKFSLETIGQFSPESNFAVKVEFVRALLKKHGIPCERADARPLSENRPDAVEEAARAVTTFYAEEKDQ